MKTLEEINKKVTKKRDKKLRYFNGKEGLSEVNNIFFELDTVKFSNTLVLIESELMKKIDLDEMVEQKWVKKPELCPNLVELIDWSNGLYKWTQTTILKGKKKENLIAIKKIIEIAHYCVFKLKSINIGNFFYFFLFFIFYFIF